MLSTENKNGKEVYIQTGERKSEKVAPLMDLEKVN